MTKRFIVLDLDGTILDKTRALLPGARERLAALKGRGHILAVCSNNVLAEQRLVDAGVRDLFSAVVAQASSTHKAVEFRICVDALRRLYKSKETRWKARTNRILFVDDDPDNRREIELRYGVHTFGCIETVYRQLCVHDAPPAQKIE